MRIEITNMEYRVDVRILFRQVNMIHNPRNNANDREKGPNPIWLQAYEIASMLMGNTQLTHKQDLPIFREISRQYCSAYLAIYVLDLSRAALTASKQQDHYRKKSSTAYTGVEESPDKAKSSGKVGSNTINNLKKGL